MDTTETAEARPQNPEDEYNFADYDNEGMPFNSCIFPSNLICFSRRR